MFFFKLLCVVSIEKSLKGESLKTGTLVHLFLASGIVNIRWVILVYPAALLKNKILLKSDFSCCILCGETSHILGRTGASDQQGKFSFS